MKYHDLNDYELSDLCKQGDTDAFDAIVRRYQHILYVTVIQIVQDLDRAKDVVQNVFIKAWQKIDTYNPDYRLYSWIYRIAINEALNAQRDQRDAESIPDDLAHNESADHSLHQLEESAALQRAIHKLPLEQRIVLSLRYFEDLPYREIAQTLDIDEGLVKSRLHAARTGLRSTLDKDSFFQSED
jgi:RNA polymerase sigma-70 factor, ECF subfamily